MPERNRVALGRIVLHQNPERPLQPRVEGNGLENKSVIRRFGIAARLLAYDAWDEKPPSDLHEEFGVKFLIWLKGKFANNGFSSEHDALSSHYRSLRWDSI